MSIPEHLRDLRPVIVRPASGKRRNPNQRTQTKTFWFRYLWVGGILPRMSQGCPKIFEKKKTLCSTIVPYKCISVTLHGLRTPRPAKGVSWALRARSAPECSRKRGVSEGVSDGVSPGPLQAPGSGVSKKRPESVPGVSGTPF